MFRVANSEGGDCGGRARDHFATAGLFSAFRSRRNLRKRQTAALVTGMASTMECMLVSNSRNLGLPGRAFIGGRRIGILFFCFFFVVSLGPGSHRARAADLSANPAPAEYQPAPAAEFSWNGVYVGVNVGGGVDHFGFLYALHSPAPAGFAQGSAGITSLGPVGGLQIGFNYELPLYYVLPFLHIVASIELDDSVAGISGQTTANGLFLDSRVPFSATFASRFDDFGTGRLRLGYAWGRFLPYLTAGFTVGVIQTSYNFSTPAFLNSAESTAVRSGAFPHVGNGGIGIEYALDSHFTVKSEYLYEFINARRTFFSPGDGIGVSFGTRTMYHIIRLGFNYKFD